MSVGDTREQIARALQKVLYEDYFSGKSPTLMNDEFGVAQAWHLEEFRKARERLCESGLAKLRTSGPCYEIALKGILDAEEQGLSESTSMNRRIQLELLKGFAEGSESDERLDRRISEVTASVESLTDAPSATVTANLEFLVEAHQLEFRTMGFMRLTRFGAAAVKDWKRRQDLEDKFNGFRAITNPQQRGRAFQTAFGDLIRDAGWETDESVKTPGEELDLFFSKGDVFGSAECRWKDHAVEAKEIRDFIVKLQKRANVLGVFVSMSGFSAGSQLEVDGVAGTTPIVLFGPLDTEALFTSRAKFDAVLQQKRRALLAKRRASWE